MPMRMTKKGHVTRKLNTKDLTAEILKQVDMVLDDLADEFLHKTRDLLLNGQWPKPAVGRGARFDNDLSRSGRVHSQFLRKVVVYDMPYTKLINFGSTGHPVELNKLIRWVHKRLRVTDRAAAYKRAENIKDKIEQQGTPPRPFFTYAVSYIRSRAVIRAALKRNGF